MKRKAGEKRARDASLDTLLDLDGTVLVIDEKGGYWVKFEVRRVDGNANERLVGFDNAHGVRRSAGPGGKRRTAYGHKHRLRTIGPYEYRDAAALLSDFWTEVDAVLTERGVLP